MSFSSTEDLVKSLTSDAYNYYCAAKKYYMENELEGALINFLLALNNLKNVKKALTNNDDDNDTKIIMKEAAAAVPTTTTCDLSDIQDGTDNAIVKILSYVRPLQEQLKRIKNEQVLARVDGDGGDDDGHGGAAITFDDVYGQDEAKSQIRNSILYPLLYPRLFPNLSKGILFYGSPGTGKTLLARASVNQQTSGRRIILYTPKSSSDLMKCAAAAAATEATEAAETAKVISVIFIDDIEASGGELLQEMVTGNPNPNVVVMATTNYPWKLDETVLCHFDTKIYIKLPTATDICMIIKTEFTNNFIKKALAAPGGGDGDDNKAAAAAAAALKPVQIFNFYRDKYFPTTLSDDNLMTLASQLEQLLFSGADVSHLCKIVFTSMGDEARRDGRFTPTTMEDPKTLVMNPQTKQVESASNVKSAAYDQDFIFHLFNPEKEQQQQEETNDEHDAATRKITLRPHMDMFLQAVDTIKPTAQSETVQALNNYAAAGP